MLSSEAPKFDAEMTAVYSKMANQHAHPCGPWPMILEEVKKVAKDGDKIVDVASGMGEPALTIAKALPDVTVTSTDFSEDMVRKAEVAAADLSNMTAIWMDAQDMKAFEDGSVDVVTSCYGYMFPEDKVRALQETRRILKEGGVLIATTWDNVDILKISRDIMKEVLGEIPPAPPLNPMALSEPGLFESLIVEAGFEKSKISQTTSSYPFDLGDERDFQFKVGTLLLRDKLDELDKWDVAEKAFWDNIDKYSKIENGNRVMPSNTFRMTVVQK